MYRSEYFRRGGIPRKRTRARKGRVARRTRRRSGHVVVMTASDVNELLLRTSAGKSSAAGLYWIANFLGIAGANGYSDLERPRMYISRAALRPCAWTPFRLEDISKINLPIKTNELYFADEIEVMLPGLLSTAGDRSPLQFGGRYFNQSFNWRLWFPRWKKYK